MNQYLFGFVVGDRQVRTMVGSASPCAADTAKVVFLCNAIDAVAAITLI